MLNWRKIQTHLLILKSVLGGCGDLPGCPVQLLLFEASAYLPAAISLHFVFMGL